MFYATAEKHGDFLAKWRQREFAFDTKRRYVYYGERMSTATAQKQAQRGHHHTTSPHGSAHSDTSAYSKQRDSMRENVSLPVSPVTAASGAFPTAGRGPLRDGETILWKGKMKLSRIVVMALVYEFNQIDPYLKEKDYYTIELHGNARPIGDEPPTSELPLIERPEGEAGDADSVTETQLYEALHDQFKLLKLEKDRLRDYRLAHPEEVESEPSTPASDTARSSRHSKPHKGFWSRLKGSSTSRMGSTDNLRAELPTPDARGGNNTSARNFPNSQVTSPAGSPTGRTAGQFQDPLGRGSAFPQGNSDNGSGTPTRAHSGVMGGTAERGYDIQVSGEPTPTSNNTVPAGNDPNLSRSNSGIRSATTAPTTPPPATEENSKIRTLESPKRTGNGKDGYRTWLMRFYTEREFRRFTFVLQAVLGYDSLTHRPHDGLPPYDPRNGIPFGTVPTPLWYNFKQLEDTVFYAFHRGELVGIDANQHLSVTLPECYLCITYDMVFIARVIGTIPRWVLLKDIVEVHYNTTSQRPFISLISDGRSPDVVFIPLAPKFGMEDPEKFKGADVVMNIQQILEQTCFDTMGARRMIKCIERNDVPSVRAYCTLQAHFRHFRWNQESGFQNMMSVPLRKTKLATLWNQVLAAKRLYRHGSTLSGRGVTGVSLAVEDSVGLLPSARQVLSHVTSTSSVASTRRQNGEEDQLTPVTTAPPMSHGSAFNLMNSTANEGMVLIQPVVNEQGETELTYSFTRQTLDNGGSTNRTTAPAGGTLSTHLSLARGLASAAASAENLLLLESGGNPEFPEAEVAFEDNAHKEKKGPVEEWTIPSSHYIPRADGKRTVEHQAPSIFCTTPLTTADPMSICSSGFGVSPITGFGTTREFNNKHKSFLEGTHSNADLEHAASSRTEVEVPMAVLLSPLGDDSDGATYRHHTRRNTSGNSHPRGAPALPTHHMPAVLSTSAAPSHPPTARGSKHRNSPSVASDGSNSSSSFPNMHGGSSTNRSVHRDPNAPKRPETARTKPGHHK